MSIRDIIEAQRKAEEAEEADESHSTWTAEDFAAQLEAENNFIRTFNPEHVALIEAVVEAAEEVHESLEIGNRFCDASWNLRQYRKERGLL